MFTEGDSLKTMHNSELLRSAFNELYVFTTSDIMDAARVQPEYFMDDLSALRFIRGLFVPQNVWTRLANQCHDYLSWETSQHSTRSEGFVAKKLVQGRIKALKIKDGDKLNQHMNVSVLDDARGRSYFISQVAFTLLFPAHEVQQFEEKPQVRVFLQSLTCDENKARKILAQYGISENSCPSSRDRLTEAILSGELVVIILKKKSRRGQNYDNLEVSPIKIVDRPITYISPEPNVNAKYSDDPETATDELPEQENIVAQAQTLKTAFLTGAPFCRVCEEKLAGIV